MLWRIAAFYVLFSGLAAAQLWPSLEFTALSVRAGVGYAYVSGGFPLRDTAQMLLPGFLSTYSPLYVGLVPLGLALLGGAWAVRSVMPAVLRAAPTRFNGFSASQPAVETAATAATQPAWAIALFFALLALLSLLVSYGHNGFLYPIFYRLAPGWAFFRGQERAAFWWRSG